MEPSLTIDAQFERLRSAVHATSLLKKYLTEQTFQNLKHKRTKFGGTLSQCINSGIEQLDVEIGVRATDPDAYVTFDALFKPVIKDYHEIPMEAEIRHLPHCFGSTEDLKINDLDPSGKYVISTRVRVGRNLEGFPFQSLLSVEQRAEIEAKVKVALTHLKNEYEGIYFPIEEMTEEKEKELVQNHFLFNHSNRSSRSAGVYRDWPKNRGIFISNTEKFLVWVSETDHIRIISMQPGGRIDDVYWRLVQGVRLMEEQLKFVHSLSYGYMTFCPTNLGTTLRASVHIKIPRLAAKSKLLEEVCSKHNLQIRGLNGDGTDIVGDVFDISNKRRMGLTEIQAVVEMTNGIQAIIEEEKKLEES